ncbi:MAG: flippase-like domain-containing protein [Defluviitaleaceae bacterium]|nr:flippase-like domain-containing protein [Defluviitaleaceae bacterium]MCL2261618.1 flippase-like domain-containing protein [Defluviitaleaceae bacterium]
MNKTLKTVLKLCVAVVLLGYILWTNDLSAVAEHFFAIPLTIWVFVLVLQASNVFISAIRLSLFVENHKLRTLLYVRLVSNAYSVILPGQMAAEGVRIYMLGNKEKKYSQAGVAVVLDKIISVLMLFVFGLVGMITTRSLGIGTAAVFVVGIVVLFLFIFLLEFSFFYCKINNLLRFFCKSGGKIGKIFSFAVTLLENWKSYTKDRVRLLKNSLYALLFHLTLSLSGTLMTYGIGGGFYLLDWLWIHAVFTFALILPISIGGMGVREGSLIALLGIIGVVPEQALAVSFSFLTLKLAQALVGVGLMIGAEVFKKER